MRLLAGREHSSSELRRKLLDRGCESAAVERILAGLREKRLLSDERFAESYVEQRVGKGYGPLRIRAELRERGIEGPLIDRLLALDDADWLERLAEIHKKKFGSRPPGTRAELARQARFLEYRGFSTSQVCRFLDLED